jgi:hypothetical protein
MVTVNELTAISNANGLSLYQTQRFVAFAQLWKGGKESDMNYLNEWASRFRKQCDYVMADDATRKLLAKVDGEYAPGILESQYRRLDWCDESIDEQVKNLRILMKYV